jgi:hypothetical protein
MTLALFLAGQIAGMAAGVRPLIMGTASQQLSRVEKFKMAEAAAARASLVPVPSTIVAFERPELPVQVLAVRIDEAEDVKVKPMRLKTKPLRLSKAARTKKVAGRYEVALLLILVANDAPITGSSGRRLRGKVAAESPRDITNRSLGVLVAMRN